MVIDHAHGLHEGVADGRADEAEAASFEFLTHGSGFLGLARNLMQAAPAVLNWETVDEIPQQSAEARL